MSVCNKKYKSKLVCSLIIQISTFPLADLVPCFIQFLLCVLPLFVHSVLCFVPAASLLVAWLAVSLCLPLDPHVGASLRCLAYASRLRCNIPCSDVVRSDVQYQLDIDVNVSALRLNFLQHLFSVWCCICRWNKICAHFLRYVWIFCSQLGHFLCYLRV